MTKQRLDLGVYAVSFIVFTGLNIAITFALFLSLLGDLTAAQMQALALGAGGFHFVLLVSQLIWAKRVKDDFLASLIALDAIGSGVAGICSFAAFWLPEELLQNDALLLIRNSSIASVVLAVLLVGFMGAILLVRDIHTFTKEML